jgi:curved DNA-binding protein CbpA
MKNRRNFYRLLQVQPDAPIEVIRASFRTLMRELKEHPDLGGSTARAALLNEAYAVLSNPERRAAYDRRLFEEYTKQAFPPDSSDKRPLVTLFCPFCKTPLARKTQPGERCSVCQTPLQSKNAAALSRAYRRSVFRIKRNGRILYRSVNSPKAREAEMIDVSPKGMRFLCSEKVEPGSILKVSGPTFEASATATNIHERVVEGRKLYAVGVSFLAVDFEDAKGAFFSASA